MLKIRRSSRTGEVEARGEHYFGSALYRCARVMALAHGGQTLVSGVTATLVSDGLPEQTSLRDLSVHRLKDLVAPEHVHQVVHPDLPAEFPPLRSLSALPHNLPIQLTSFVGRERELAEIEQA